MISTNTRPSSVLPAVDRVPPQTIAAAGVQNTGWIDAGLAEWLVAIINIGVVSAGGTMTLSWLQATSAAGAGSKALNTGAFAPVTYTATGQAIVEEHVGQQIDVANGFRWVRAVLTGAVANVIVGMTLHQGAPRNETGPTISS